MKFFLDTANIEEIKEADNLGILDGITTNPSLLAKEIKRTSKTSSQILTEILQIMNPRPVSIEVLSFDMSGMIAEAGLVLLHYVLPSSQRFFAYRTATDTNTVITSNMPGNGIPEPSSSVPSSPVPSSGSPVASSTAPFTLYTTTRFPAE